METVTPSIEKPSFDREKMSRTAKAAIEEGNRFWEETLDSVRRKPAQSLGWTLLAGAAVGAGAALLFARRSSHSHWAPYWRAAEVALQNAVEKGLQALKR